MSLFSAVSGPKRISGISFATSVVRNFNKEANTTHFRKLAYMYSKAPVSGLVNVHDNLAFETNEKYPRATLRMTALPQFNHPGGSMHGVAYFKLLDDTAWFTAQALVNDNFIYTTSFVTYITRPVLAGTKLLARGKIINATKTLIIAESEVIEEETGKLVASGSGTFQRGYVALSEVPDYVKG